jgi:Protein of unknown function (DUF3105)
MAKGQEKGSKASPRAGVRASQADKGGGRLTRRQRSRLAWGALAVAVILVVGAAGWLYARVWAPLPGEFVQSLGNAHIQAAETPHQPYNSDPPTSGPHLPYIAPWGVHGKPLAKELQVHNLEDGGVVVNYRPDCEAQVLEPLKTVVGRYADHVVLAPYPGLDRCIALTAWTRIEKLDQFDERRVSRFIDAYRGIDHHPR